MSGRNNLLSKMFTIPFLCILASGSLSAATISLHESCESDGDCPADYFCYSVTKICAPCKPNFCSRYNRKDSWRKCHSKPSECGPCLPGFEEEIFSDGSYRGACLMSHQPTPAQAMGYATIMQGPSATYLSGVIGLPLLILVVGFFIIYNRTHNSNRRPPPPAVETELKPMCRPTRSSDDDNSDANFYALPTAPMLPEYSREDPFLPCQNSSWNTSDDSGHLEHRVEIKQKLDTVLPLQSAVFRRPDYEEERQDSLNAANDPEGEDGDETDSQEDEVSSVRTGRQTLPPLQYHDENTMPSNWTPGPQAAEDENSNLATNSENPKRPSTDMVSSESEDENSPKRICNDEDEEQNEARSSSVLPTIYHTFSAALSSVRNPNSTNNTNPQIRNPNNTESETNDQ